MERLSTSASRQEGARPAADVSGTAGSPSPAWRRSPLLLAALLAATQARAGSGQPTVAFFYGRSVPVAELAHFDWVVVEPENLDARGLTHLQRAGVQVFGYLSLGEAAPGSVDSSWVLGRNAGWGTVIVDPAASGWRERVLDRAGALSGRGYQGLFLDTLDSYVSALAGEEARRAAGAALATLIRDIHQRYPALKLFFNRGFELMDDVGDLACGVAAESLFFGWDAAGKRYVEVSGADRDWLTRRLRRVKDRLGLPVVVVDYLPPARREEAREDARRIEALGFTPWVSTPSLDVLGVGTLEVVPRRLLLLYDGAEFPALARSPVHRFGALPVEVLGCAADYHDVRQGPPPEPLAGRYAGVVTWFTDDDLPDAVGYTRWLTRQIEAGVRVAMLGRPGFAPARSFLAGLGLAESPAAPSRVARVVKRDDLVGLEAEPEPRSRGLLPWHAVAPQVTVHLRVEDSLGRPIDPVVTAPWGGLALDPYVLEPGYQGRARWIVDPFAFLAAALALPPAPAFDLTTENGARLLVVVADGEGFALPAGRGAVAADAILGEVLAALPLPTTVAIPPGELEVPHGPSRLRDLARAVFALPGVEPAARPSSVPRMRESGLASGGEVVEAAVDRMGGLLPGGKPPRAFLWADAGLVAPGPADEVEGRGMANLASARPHDETPPSLAEIPPSGCPAGDSFLVYLPGSSWSGASAGWEPGGGGPAHPFPLAGRAGDPRRLTAMGLSYPFRIGADRYAVRSLVRALRWALEQGALPLWSSEYALRVRGFQAASMARRLDGTWQFRDMGALRTVRLPRALGWPDPSRSRGVASISELGDFRYVGFGPEERPVLALSERQPPGPYLAWANAPLERWEPQGQTVSLRFRGHQPVRLAVAGAACTLTVGGREVRPERADGRDTFSLAGADTGDARIQGRSE